MTISTPALLFLAFVIFQRLSELWIAKRNTAKLLERGAIEHGQDHYAYMVAMHTCWIVALVIFGLSQPLNVFWLLLFIILQGIRIWILSTLGERWTTRIIVIDEPLVLGGPFRYFRHPNYMLVIAEIIVTPMVLGLWWVALLFTVLNSAMLYVRIGTEERALAHLRNAQPKTD